MLDLKWIRANEQEFIDGLIKRGVKENFHNISDLDRKWRAEQEKLDELRHKKNDLAKLAAHLDRSSDAFLQNISESQKITEEMNAIAANAEAKKLALNIVMSFIPNLPADEVPDGDCEDQNVLIKTWGEKREFDFEPKQHDVIGKRLGLSCEDGVTIAGSRFVVLYGQLAKLERALASFMLEEHIAAGYQEVSVPYLVREESMHGSGNLPKFREDSFCTASLSHLDGNLDVDEAHDNSNVSCVDEIMDFISRISESDLSKEFAQKLIAEAEFLKRSNINKPHKWLIPTSEVPLVNLVRDKIFEQHELPLHYTAYTPCFRSEAGSAGKANHGLTRVHQFNKVELVKIVSPENSDEEHEKIARSAENILEKLRLHYRRMLLCSREMGFASKKTYDLEVWLPAERCYREISSCSNCGDFQARRIGAKVKRDKGNVFVHTLNGSGLAVGRTIIAILENYQQKDGSVRIPDVLKRYFPNGQEIF